MKLKVSLIILSLYASVVFLWGGVIFSVSDIEPIQGQKQIKTLAYSLTTLPPSPTPTRTKTPVTPENTPTKPLSKTPKHALIHFSLTGKDNIDIISPTAVIISARLSLFVIQAIGTGASQINIYKITDPDNLGMWSEDGAAFLRRDGLLGLSASAIPWTLNPGSSVLDSINYPASGTLTLPVTSGWADSHDGSTRGLKNDVQDWLTNPALNQGWFLEFVSLRSGTWYCVSRHDSSHPALNPKLVIEYTLPSSTVVHTVSIPCDADTDGIIPSKENPGGYLGSGRSTSIVF